VPEEGIVDYPQVCDALAREIRGEVITGARVTAIHRDGKSWRVISTAGEYMLRANRHLRGPPVRSSRRAYRPPRTIRIVPFRGEYYKIRPERQHLVRNLIYPVPDPKFPFPGCPLHPPHSRRSGSGSNAVLAFAREGYRKTDFNAAELFDALAFSGLRRFPRKVSEMCWQEIRRSFSRDLFCASLQRLVPEIQPDDLIEGGSGVRAQAMAPDGSLIEDFHFVQGPGELHVVNAPSPGATASLGWEKKSRGSCSARFSVPARAFSLRFTTAS